MGDGTNRRIWVLVSTTVVLVAMFLIGVRWFAFSAQHEKTSHKLGDPQSRLSREPSQPSASDEIQVGSGAAQSSEPIQGEVIERVFQRLKSGKVTKPKDLVQQELVPIGKPAIDAMISKLKRPRFDAIGYRVIENEDLIWATKVLSFMGDEAFFELKKYVNVPDPYFRANVLRGVFRFDREECFDILVNAFSDTRLSEKPTPIHETPPSRICDLAYGLLRVKLNVLELPRPETPKSFNVLPIATKDEEIAKLQEWWEENRGHVLEKFRSTKKE